ncbi:MAG: preprotein translocase subunit SecG [Betaproteobacteria bacterium]|nr:preprotein translocase subunit SecG [Betaproteobacteria bacterium]
MGYLENVLWVVHIIVAIAICGFVLMQHGKGADMGAAFGGGASGSIFGSAGSANFLSRTTAALATVFFVTSLGLTYYSAQHSGGTIGGSIMDRVAPTTQPAEQSATPPAETKPAQPADVPVAPATGATTSSAIPAAGTTSAAPAANDVPATPATSPTTSSPQEKTKGKTAPKS